MDKSEFSERVRRCQERLWRISYMILQNEADCDDAVQEALVRAWKYRWKLREKDYFETWLVRILINASRSIAAKRKNDVDISDLQIAAKAEDESLKNEIGRLDLKYRLPLVLHYIEGYSVGEISQMTHLPVSTVKWRLHAARKMLREALEV